MNAEDFQTGCWKRVSEALAKRIDELRLSNDAQHDEINTARIRGGICELKRILALADLASAGHGITLGDANDGQVAPDLDWSTEGNHQ